MTDDDEMPRAIRVVCDEPSPLHPKKRPTVQVTSFRRIGDGWTESNASPYRQKTLGTGSGLPDSGTTLVGDEPFSADVHGMRPDGVRSVYEFRCSKCKAGPYQYQQATLFRALNLARHTGRKHLTLAELAAIVQNMARDSA